MDYSGYQCLRVSLQQGVARVREAGVAIGELRTLAKMASKA